MNTIDQTSFITGHHNIRDIVGATIVQPKNKPVKEIHGYHISRVGNNLVRSDGSMISQARRSVVNISANRQLSKKLESTNNVKLENRLLHAAQLAQNIHHRNVHGGFVLPESHSNIIAQRDNIPMRKDHRITQQSNENMNASIKKLADGFGVEHSTINPIIQRITN